MKFEVPIIIREWAGISREREPVTVGIPMPKGVLTANHQLGFSEPGMGALPIQIAPLAHWSDGSIKWVLLDFQARVAAGERKELSVQVKPATPELPPPMPLVENDKEIIVDTGAAHFFLPAETFLPFSQVVVDGRNCLAGRGSATVLTDQDGRESLPVIATREWETRGALRSTLKITGYFPDCRQRRQLLSFIARLSFFAGLSACKIDFTLWNPRPAMHPGGLWDLGDPGSFFFEDLAMHVFPHFTGVPAITWQDAAGAAPLTAAEGDLRIYQDSSGGVNWQSRNHVNRHNEVKTSFRGYKVTGAEKEIKKGLRAEPVISVNDERQRISAGIQYFWQNFPKALEADQEKITIRLFPHHFDDVYELQGGECKTHTCLLDFRKRDDQPGLSGWLHRPLEVRSTPAWYADSLAIPYLIPENQASEKELLRLIQPAIEGDNTFFDRREVVDEYGWRNFGDWYADHEAIGYQGPPPLVSHYNNQYDGILGALRQYMKSADSRWYVLGDQLARHVRDIDIYHTSEDKPEFIKGLFWHTEHYLPVQTATHRCFSRRHAGERNLSFYGGGPASCHNYAEGLLYHYYLTGESASRAAVLDLAEYIQNAIISRTTLTCFLVEVLRKTKNSIKNAIKGRDIVDFTKVYGFDGPGRTSGNSLSTLLTAFELTGQEKYLRLAEEVILLCIHPGDDIDSMDIFDIENRWMYTVFLQAMGKYLDLNAENSAGTSMWEYARASLLHYARWMAANEYLYLETPEKLEYPNETWAAQEIRKCNVFLYAAKYCPERERRLFVDKAFYFYHGGLRQLQSHQTRNLTRPITILLQNGLMSSFFQTKADEAFSPLSAAAKTVNDTFRLSLEKKKSYRQLRYIFRAFSVKKEAEFIRWRIKKSAG
jgi:hypothetical protein